MDKALIRVMAEVNYFIIENMSFKQCGAYYACYITRTSTIKSMVASIQQQLQNFKEGWFTVINQFQYDRLSLRSTFLFKTDKSFNIRRSISRRCFALAFRSRRRLWVDATNASLHPSILLKQQATILQSSNMVQKKPEVYFVTGYISVCLNLFCSGTRGRSSSLIT